MKRRRRWSLRTWSERAAGDLRAVSESRCTQPHWSISIPPRSSASPRQSACWNARRQSSNMPAHSLISAPRNDAAIGVPRREVRSKRDSSSRGGAVPPLSSQHADTDACRGRTVERPDGQRRAATHRVRTARRGARGQRAIQSRHCPGAVRDSQDSRNPSRPRVFQARDNRTRAAGSRVGEKTAEPMTRRWPHPSDSRVRIRDEDRELPDAGVRRGHESSR